MKCDCGATNYYDHLSALDRGYQAHAYRMLRSARCPNPDEEDADWTRLMTDVFGPSWVIFGPDAMVTSKKYRYWDGGVIDVYLPEE